MAGTPVSNLAALSGAIPPDVIRRELDLLLASPHLVNSSQLCRFLRHLVERTLAGDTLSLKEGLLGTEVFERGYRFDPRTDPVVRVEARRLRAKLEACYTSGVTAGEITISLPKGSYVPVFQRRDALMPAAVEALPEPSPAPVIVISGAAAAAPVREAESVPAQIDSPVEAKSPPAADPRRRLWLTIGAVAFVLALGAAWWLERPAVPAGPPSVAVLPFVNVGSNPETEYFADGLTDELINILGHTDGLRVVARSSVFQYKGRTGDARGIGQQLNATVLVEGSVRKQGSRLRIAAQLVDARNGFEIWSQTLDREWQQVFSMQQEIAAAIASRLRIRLAEPRGGRRTGNLDAYNLYLKGRYHWNKRTPAGFESAIAAFRQAIDIDPNYATAWAGLADSYCMLGFLNAVPPEEVRLKASEAARRALQLDDTLAEAHAAQGSVRAIYDWDNDGAETAFRRAIELDPNYSTAHYALSKSLAVVGRLDEALVEMRRAQELDPLAMMINSSLAWELAGGRRYPEADAAFRAAFELDPNFIWTYVFHGWMLESKGDFSGAIADLTKATNLSGSSTLALGELAHALGQAGRKQEASVILDQLIQASKQHYVSPFDLSRAYEGLGRRDEAMTALSRAADDRSPIILFLKVEPVFDPLRNDPRFGVLLKRLHLN